MDRPVSKGVSAATALALLMTYALGFASAHAAARPAAPKTAPAMQSVLDCRSIAEDAKRLACYDAAVAAMAKAEESGDLLAIDREQRRTVRRQAFGLSLPSFTLFDKGEKPEEANRISVTLARAFRNENGRWVLVLDDGAVWRQIDDTEMYDIPPKAGQKAVIRRAALGSFMMKIEGQPSIRVHRDN